VDNPQAERVFGPSRAVAWLIAVAGVGAGAATFADTDRPGRLLLGCVAFVLLAIAVSDLIFWPRLRATSSGLAIWTPAQRLRLAWAEVDVIRVDERSHLGLASRALEIESGSVLVVLSKRSLGPRPA